MISARFRKMNAKKSLILVVTKSSASIFKTVMNVNRIQQSLMTIAAEQF